MWLPLVGEALACDLATLGAHLDAAEAAVRADSPAPLFEALAAARVDLGCATERVDPAASARLHRALAAEALAAGEPARAVRALQAMLHADPFAELDPALPADHLLRPLLLAAEEAPLAYTRAPTQRVDGALAGRVPVGLSPVLQPAEGGPARLGTPAKGGGSAALRGAALALGGLGVGAYAGAWGARSAYRGAGDLPTATRWHTATNGLSITSGVALVAGAGLLLADLR